MVGVRWVAALALVIGGAGLAADTSRLRTLDGVHPGRWLLRDLAGTTSPQTICVTRRADFIYLGHPATGCTARTIADDPPHAVIQFSCPARTGRTTITAETADLLTIDAQGMEGGAPFAHRTEARWQGSCVR